ncbi:MAG TPA: hypothetical protein PLZ51_14660 [Aggregatilineales bacterium]|nr:hypothetical protein [Aggregatilineales bacterium]
MLNTHCRLCGLDQIVPPRNERGWASWLICECCGTEAGFDDEEIDIVRKRRRKWLEDGAKWFDPLRKPENWNLEEQLKNIPPEWL